MVTTEEAVESRPAIPDRERRKTPQEIEGFQSVVLSPGGPVDALNLSNSGILVETGARAKPGSAVQVRIFTAGGNHEVEAKVVRSEVMTVSKNGIRYELAIAFDTPLDLIDWDDAAAVDAPAPSGPATPMDLLPPDQAPIDLQLAHTPNRW